jgi:hypothetical protein
VYGPNFWGFGSIYFKDNSLGETHGTGHSSGLARVLVPCGIDRFLRGFRSSLLIYWSLCPLQNVLLNMAVFWGTGWLWPRISTYMW